MYMHQHPQLSSHRPHHLGHTGVGGHISSPGGLRIQVIPTIDCDRRHPPFFTIVHILIHIDPSPFSDHGSHHTRNLIESALQAFLDRIVVRRHPSPLDDEVLKIDLDRLPRALDAALTAFRAQWPGVDVRPDLTRLRRDVSNLLELYKRVKEWFGDGQVAPQAVGARTRQVLVRANPGAAKAEWDEIMARMGKPVRSREQGNRTDWVSTQRATPRDGYKEREYFPR